MVDRGAEQYKIRYKYGERNEMKIKIKQTYTKWKAKTAFKKL